MGEARGMHEQATAGCLPVDQSCFALSQLSSAYRNSSNARNNDPACCSTTSYLEVLGISFASLLIILFVLCMIRCYLMRRAVNRVTVGAAGVTPASAAVPCAVFPGRSSCAADPAGELNEDAGGQIQSEGDEDVARWRPVGFEARGLPVRHGTPADPRLQRRSGGGATAARLLRRHRLRYP